MYSFHSLSPFEVENLQIFAPQRNAYACYCQKREAKYQGESGNAEERWYKNAQWISHINSKCIYYTLASGTGCRKTFVDAQMMSYITYNSRNLLDSRWSLQENGFTYEEVKEIFVSSLNEILGKSNKPFQYPQPLGKLNV